MGPNILHFPARFKYMKSQQSGRGTTTSELSQRICQNFIYVILVVTGGPDPWTKQKVSLFSRCCRGIFWCTMRLWSIPACHCR